MKSEEIKHIRLSPIWSAGYLGFFRFYTLMETHIPKKRFYPVMTRTVITGKKLFKKYNTRYLFMLHNLMKNGMDIRTAIWECYNELEVVNG